MADGLEGDHIVDCCAGLFQVWSLDGDGAWSVYASSRQSAGRTGLDVGSQSPRTVGRRPVVLQAVAADVVDVCRRHGLVFDQ